MISMVSKNWKLFVAPLPGFWLHEMLLGHLEKKMFPTKTTKIERANGPDPLIWCIRVSHLVADHHVCTVGAYSCQI